MKFIRIVNWSQFQHYKNRDPIWIKLHRGLLQSRTWVTGDDASRTLAIALMLLAAMTDNKIPADVAYIRRVAYLNREPDFSPLLASQFIEMIDDASNVLADCKREASNSLAQRREEKSREEKKNPSAALARKRERDASRIYELYPRKVGKADALKAIAKAIKKVATEQKTSEGDAADFIYSAVVKFAESPAGHKGEYTPHCATWMNAGRYFDDPNEWHKVNSNGNGHKSDRTQEVIDKVFQEIETGVQP